MMPARWFAGRPMTCLLACCAAALALFGFGLALASCAPNEQPGQKSTQQVAETSVPRTAQQNAEAPLSCAISYSAETAFISDPIFALYFDEDASGGYGSFYLMAQRAGANARMAVIAEEQAAVTFPALAPITETIPPAAFGYAVRLSEAEKKAVMRARSVVVSPLLDAFAPQFFAELLDYRARCGLSKPLRLSLARPGVENETQNIQNNSAVAALLPPEEKSEISIDYMPALAQLAAALAELMKTKNLTGLAVVLDTSDPAREADVRYILNALRELNPAVSPRFIWEDTVPQAEDLLYRQLDLVRPSEAVLLHAGIYTARASQYLYGKDLSSAQRIVAVSGWLLPPPLIPIRQIDRAVAAAGGLYAAYAAYAPLSALFEPARKNKRYAAAGFYRILQTETNPALQSISK